MGTKKQNIVAKTSAEAEYKAFKQNIG